MTVAELIEFLKTQPQDLQVIYNIYSEAAVLTPDLIEVCRACPPRPDKWVHNYRKGETYQEYLCFPGN